jgi:hypothetical protein
MLSMLTVAIARNYCLLEPRAPNRQRLSSAVPLREKLRDERRQTFKYPASHLQFCRGKCSRARASSSLSSPRACAHSTPAQLRTQRDSHTHPQQCIKTSARSRTAARDMQPPNARRGAHQQLARRQVAAEPMRTCSEPEGFESGRDWQLLTTSCHLAHSCAIQKGMLCVA